MTTTRRAVRRIEQAQQAAPESAIGKLFEGERKVRAEAEHGQDEP